MIERNHKGLNMSKQAEVLPTSLSEIYYNSKDKIDNRIKVGLGIIDKIHTKYPFYGARRISQDLIRMDVQLIKNVLLNSTDSYA